MLKPLALAAVVLSFAAFAASAAAAPAISTEDALLQEINRVRAVHGLRPLALDPALGRAARAHTTAMATSKTFDHGDFGGRMRRFHASGPCLGENLFWGAGPSNTPRAVVQGWLESPGHRANLLRPGFDRVGLGEVQTSFKGAAAAIVVTADFAGV